MPFIGRQAELEVLRRAHASRKSALIPIYGRRRIGKSELIQRFMRDTGGVYFLGKTAPAALQLGELMRVAARALGQPLLAKATPESWREALELIVEHASRGRKLVLALDEFQWMAQVSLELPSILQELWDREWKSSGKVFLILCGSFVGFMEREVLGRKSPLFGRRSAQIHLGPLSYLDAARFFPSWSVTDRARAYFICGGVPLYLELFESDRSVEQNIEHLIFDDHSPLFHEPDFLLREELREVESYYAVLMTLASGSSTHGEIARRAQVPERSLGYYLKQLQALGYVDRRFPLKGRKPSPREVRYAVRDPLLRFWFRFVFANLSFIGHEGGQRTFREMVRPELDAYFGSCFEALCREALPWLYRREGVTGHYEVGQYWAPDLQVDVVGLRSEGVTDLGECKWGSRGGRRELERRLGHVIASYPNPRGATLQPRAFVQRRPAETPAGAVRWHDLADLYDV